MVKLDICVKSCNTLNTVNDGITINFDVRKIHPICEKYYIWNPATSSCENGKYLASIIDDSVITCDEIIEEETKAVIAIFNEKKFAKQKMSMFYLLFY